MQLISAPVYTTLRLYPDTDAPYVHPTVRSRVSEFDMGVIRNHVNSGMVAVFPILLQHKVYGQIDVQVLAYSEKTGEIYFNEIYRE